MKFKAYKVLTIDNRASNNYEYCYHPVVNEIAVYEKEEK